MTDIALTDIEEKESLPLLRRLDLVAQSFNKAVVGIFALPYAAADALNFGSQKLFGTKVYDGPSYEEAQKAGLNILYAPGEALLGSKPVEAQTKAEKDFAAKSDLVADVTVALVPGAAIAKAPGLAGSFTKASSAWGTTKNTVQPTLEVAGTAAKETAKKGILSKNLTVGGSLAMSAAAVAAPLAAVTGLKLYEYEHGGALSRAAFNFGVSTLKEAIAEGVSVQDVESKMESLEYIMAVNSAFNKGQQSILVEGAMKQNEGADAISHGKMTAVSTQLLPHNMAVLALKQGVRVSIADDLYPGDKNAADKYLAESLIDDVVKNARVDVLEGNQVSRDDVRKVLTDVMLNPDKHPIASKFFGEHRRMTNGLKQIWPELTQAPAPSADADKYELSLTDLGTTAGVAIERARDKAGDVAENVSDTIKEQIPEEMLGLWNSVSEFAERNPNIKWAMALGAAYGAKIGGGETKTKTAANAMVYGMGFAIMASIIEMAFPGAFANMVRGFNGLRSSVGLDNQGLKDKFESAKSSLTSLESKPASLPLPSGGQSVTHQFIQAGSNDIKPVIPVTVVNTLDTGTETVDLTRRNNNMTLAMQ